MQPQASNDNQWELCKENVVPLKRGRSVKGLSDQLASNPVAATDIHKAQERAFEQGITDAIAAEGGGETSKDILDKYIVYYKWTRDTYPSQSDKALQLLERCTVALKDDIAMKNDNKFVKLWIEYADMVRTPGEVFSFMQSNKIGERNALFWVAWAFVAEKAENYKLTDQIFQKGIKKAAEPREILQKRYQQFQRRLARHYLNLAEAGAVEETGSVQAAAAAPARSALSTVAQKDQRQISTASRSKPGVLGGASMSNSTGFAIFSESGVSSAATAAESSLLKENSSWKVLGTEQQRRKENDGPVTKWTDAPLRAPSISRAPAPAVAPTIQIFVDPEPNSNSDSSVAASRPKATRQQVLSIRKQLDGLRDIATEPLALHKAAAALVAKAVEEVPGLKVDSVESRSAITSTSALPFTIFSDDTRPVEPTVRTTAPVMRDNANPNPKGFEFSRIPTIKPAVKPSPAAASNSSMPSFSIFSDDSNSQPSVKKANAMAGKSQEENEHELELNRILTELDVLDSADGTINTRLARKDIDSMFCSSPSPAKQAKRSPNRASACTAHLPMSCELSAIQESSREYSLFGHLHSPAQGGLGASTAKKSRGSSGSDVHCNSMYVSSDSSSTHSDSALHNQVVSTDDRTLIQNPHFPNDCDSLTTLISRCERQMHSCSLHAIGGRAKRGVAETVPAEEVVPAPEACTLLIDSSRVEATVQRQWQLLLPFIELYWPLQDCRPGGSMPPPLRYRQSITRGASLEALGHVFAVDATVGRGAYGHAIRCISRKDGSVVVLKVDLESFSVVWEAHLHGVVAMRSERLALLDGDVAAVHRSLLPPLGLLLYEGASVLVMRYANMGSLVDLVNTVVLLGPLLPAAEHELLCAFVASRMLSAMLLLHRCDVIHTDIKSDNWVVSAESKPDGGAPALEVYLIDLGKAKDVRSVGDAEGRRILFSGTCGVGSYACPQAGLAWGRNVDYYGTAACLHNVMFLSPLETSRERPGRGGGGYVECSTAPSTALKRYWNRDIWSRLYFLLLNSDNSTDALEAVKSDIDEWIAGQPGVLSRCFSRIRLHRLRV